VQCAQCQHYLTEPEIRKLANSATYQRSVVQICEDSSLFSNADTCVDTSTKPPRSS